LRGKFLTFFVSVSRIIIFFKNIADHHHITILLLLLLRFQEARAPPGRRA